METEMETETGVCEWCKDEYDNPRPVKLFKFKGRLACGDCCGAWSAESKGYNFAYGEN